MSLMGLVTDPYNRRARLQPALFAILPVFSVGFLLYPDIEKTAATFIGILVFSGGSVWLTQIGRERGKKIEPQLFQAWGGKPSVTLIRHSDKRINSATKSRYHQFLEKNVPHFQLPSQESEKQNPFAADDLYQTAIDWLLSKTRDTTQFRLIFEENMNYGFRRNLYALKPVALIFDIVIIFALVMVTISRETISPDDIIRTLTNLDMYIYVAFSVVTVHAVAITTLVTKAWVKVTADAYGRQLLAACDALPGQH